MTKPTQAKGKTTETAFDFVLSEALRSKHPQWWHHIQAEQTGVIEAQGLRPDILISPSNGSLMIVETECHPARTVETAAPCARIPAGCARGAAVEDRRADRGVAADRVQVRRQGVGGRAGGGLGTVHGGA